MKQVSGKRLAKAVAERGWILSRINGSHHIFTKVGHLERLVIPIHGNHPLKVGLLRSIMKLADLQEEDL